MKRTTFTTALVLLLAACNAAPDGPQPTPAANASAASPMPSASQGAAATPAADDACGAAKVQAYVGKEATVPVRSEVARVSGARSDRWIYPDSMVTQDYRADRLNVTMDKETNTIVSARCG